MVGKQPNPDGGNVDVAWIGYFYKSEESFIFYDLLADDVRRSRQYTDDGVSIHWLDYYQHPPLREMEGRPFYTVCLTSDSSSRIVGTMCSGTPVLSFRLSGIICFDHI